MKLSKGIKTYFVLNKVMYVRRVFLLSESYYDDIINELLRMKVIKLLDWADEGHDDSNPRYKVISKFEISLVDIGDKPKRPRAKTRVKFFPSRREYRHAVAHYKDPAYTLSTSTLRTLSILSVESLEFLPTDS